VLLRPSQRLLNEHRHRLIVFMGERGARGQNVDFRPFVGLIVLEERAPGLSGKQVAGQLDRAVSASSTYCASMLPETSYRARGGNSVMVSRYTVPAHRAS
jgi:hypothetical protein